MPRSLSPLAISASQALETDEIFLLLLEIDHSTLTTPYRLVNNTEAIDSEGETFLAYPFDIVFGTEDGEHLPIVQLTIDNVDTSIVDTIRRINSPPKMTIRLVIASDPDDVQMVLSGMELREVSFDAYTITGNLYAENLADTRYPRDVISLASGYEGLIK